VNFWACLAEGLGMRATVRVYEVTPNTVLQWLVELVLFQVYHNFVVPHTSLRQRLLVPAVSNGRDSAKRWRPCTPAIAAGLTDHVWTMREVLLFRVSPLPQPHAR
jgi:hypothetical protein